MSLPAFSTEAAARWRHPLALVLSADEQFLYVANRRSGSISVVDTEKQQVVKEIDVAAQLSDLTATPDGKLLLASDEAAHELLLLSAHGSDIQVRQRLKISAYPVSVSVARDGRRCYVASLWSRRLTTVELPADPSVEARVTGVLDLPFAPRKQLLVYDDTRLIVADSFAGRLGVVDTASGRLQLVRAFPGHNIRGLGVSADGRMLLISHQMLNELAHTVRNDIHWGLLMSNDLRWMVLESVLDGQRDLYKGAHMHPLGGASNGTADPNGLAVAEDGTVVVTLGGVGQIALGKESDFSLLRLNVGQRPTAVTISGDSQRAYVANTFGDSVSVIRLPKRESLAEISLGPQPPLTDADRGERLFYDAALSHDGWMSCHSCHTDGHTNLMLNDNFSDLSFGAPKRVLSLLGVADTAPYAWNAAVESLEEQIRSSITGTMQLDQSPTSRQVRFLAAYLRTLPPPPSIDNLRGQRDDAAIARGGELFESLRCTSCHGPPAYTTPRIYDVGLVDKQGNHRFNPPSLLGVGQREPYFHDNRAATLDDVLRKTKHQLKLELSDDEVRDLIAFLQSL
jgi:YVTN family beta-propeller protein